MNFRLINDSIVHVHTDVFYSPNESSLYIHILKWHPLSINILFSQLYRVIFFSRNFFHVSAYGCAIYIPGNPTFLDIYRLNVIFFKNLFARKRLPIQVWFNKYLKVPRQSGNWSFWLKQSAQLYDMISWHINGSITSNISIKPLELSTCPWLLDYFSGERGIIIE